MFALCKYSYKSWCKCKHTHTFIQIVSIAMQFCLWDNNVQFDKEVFDLNEMCDFYYFRKRSPFNKIDHKLPPDVHVPQIIVKLWHVLFSKEMKLCNMSMAIWRCHYRLFSLSFSHSSSKLLQFSNWILRLCDSTSHTHDYGMSKW